MPKRYSKGTRTFLTGAYFGRNCAYLGLQIQYQRVKKNETIENFAALCGITPEKLKHLENGDIRTFVKTSTSELTHIAEKCDVALSIKFSSMENEPAPEIAVPTWEEEFGSVRSATPV